MMENKTEIIKIRCSKEEKLRLREKARLSGRTLSEFCRELFTKGKVVAPPKFTQKELEGIVYLKKYAQNFTVLSNFLKYRDEKLSLEVKKLANEIRGIIEHFYLPRT